MLTIVDSSSGAASASATNEAMMSGVAGSINIPPTIVSTSCSRNWNRVATPKLPPAAADRPEKIWMCLSVHVQEPTVRGHDVGGKQVVNREAVLADQVPDAAAQRESPDSDRAGVAEPGREAISPRAAVYSPAVSPV